jgi:hypothetical protein
VLCGALVLRSIVAGLTPRGCPEQVGRCAAPPPPPPPALRLLRPCLEILEKVTFLSEPNAAHLVDTKRGGADVIRTLLSVLFSCQDLAKSAAAAHGEPQEEGEGEGEEEESYSARGVMAACLRVLVNLTNDQPAGCALVASTSDGAAAEGDASGDGGGAAAAAAATSGLRTILRFLSLALAYGWHDSLVVAVGLLVNLVEQNDACCEQLAELRLPACDAPTAVRPA